MEAYSIQSLTKTYRRSEKPANDQISLNIAAGSLYGIFGPNGAGKTTLVRQMIALLRPTSGAIQLFGQDIVRHPSVVPQNVGYYGQRAIALRNHYFNEVLLITGILRGMSEKNARGQAQELIERFDAVKLSQRRMATLSGGEQRVAVLLATFMAEPRVLILDEPTNELDPTRRRALWSYLHEINQKSGATIILTTHHLTEAEQVIDQVAIIDQGKIVANGTPGELKRGVDRVVRLELRLREGNTQSVEQRLGAVSGSRQVRPGRWEITTVQHKAVSLLPELIELVGFDMLDDFRLITPTMEDVYVQLTGRNWDVRAERKD